MSKETIIPVIITVIIVILFLIVFLLLTKRNSYSHRINKKYLGGNLLNKLKQQIKKVKGYVITKAEVIKDSIMNIVSDKNKLKEKIRHLKSIQRKLQSSDISERQDAYEDRIAELHTKIENLKSKVLRGHYPEQNQRRMKLRLEQLSKLENVHKYDLLLDMISKEISKKEEKYESLDGKMKELNKETI